MDIAITGSHGLIGSALARSLEADGHTVRRLVRGTPSGPGQVRWDPMGGTVDTDGLAGIDGVVHLAGAGIGDHRWSDGHKRAIRDSRAQGTSTLAAALAGMDHPPAVLVSGSAIGYYGDRDDEELTESSPPGDGFLAEVCQVWEANTRPAEAAGIRVARIRTGVVLSPAGGALGKQLLLYKLGLGGPAGRGDQWLSWITLDDHVAAVRFLLEHPVAGPVNLTAPNPVSQRTFAKELAAQLHRPAFVPVPRFVSKVPFGIGELLDNVLFTSAQVEPYVLEREGFRFRHADLDDALETLLAP